MTSSSSSPVLVSTISGSCTQKKPIQTPHTIKNPDTACRSGPAPLIQKIARTARDREAGGEAARAHLFKQRLELHVGLGLDVLAAALLSIVRLLAVVSHCRNEPSPVTRRTRQAHESPSLRLLYLSTSGRRAQQPSCPHTIKCITKPRHWQPHHLQFRTALRQKARGRAPHPFNKRARDCPRAAARPQATARTGTAFLHA